MARVGSKAHEILVQTSQRLETGPN